jgi:hypothetical protein
MTAEYDFRNLAVRHDGASEGPAAYAYVGNGGVLEIKRETALKFAAVDPEWDSNEQAIAPLQAAINEWAAGGFGFKSV